MVRRDATAMCVRLVEILYTLLIFTGPVFGALAKVPRFQHTMEIFDGQLCVFGGKSTSTGVSLRDFLLDYRCVDVTKPIKQSDPEWKLQSSASRFVMPPLAQHSSVYDRTNKIIVPYGGESPSTFSQANHLAAYSSQYQAWGASNVVDMDPRRYLHTAVLQESSGDMIIFGGASDETTNSSANTRWLNVNRMVLDTERHNQHAASLGLGTGGNTTVGNILTDSGDGTPSSIMGLIQHSSILLNDTIMVVLGGNVYNSTDNLAMNLPFDMVYVYDVDTMKWSTVDCSGDIPPERSAFSASFYNDSIYIYGGVNVSGWSQLFGDLYKLDTVSWSWTKLQTPNAPAPRYAHQMKTLGQYLVVTHGYIGTGNDTYTGDGDIYFYDLDTQSFVDKYSPKDISAMELDTQWMTQRTRKTNAISALCYILVIFVFMLALYYLVREMQEKLAQRRRSVVRARPPLRDTTIRSIVESYTENLRDSAQVLEDKYIKPIGNRRQSSFYEADGTTLASPFPDRRSSSATKETVVAAARLKANSSLPSSDSRTRSQSMSEGTSTTIGDDDTTATAARRFSHGILKGTGFNRDAGSFTNKPQRVSRKITLSAPTPTFRTSRSSDGLSVKFSDSIDEYSDTYKDLDADKEDNQVELCAIEECAEDDDDVLSSRQIRDNSGELKVVN
ncbi:hypothetical protein LPJ59_001627 [Coemansia sp. RSA 2399]|nr:hypothetical protein LPJ59_001627 [Coemansia sp. RSA 2399]